MDTSEEYITDVIVHLTVHFFFLLYYVMYLNSASYLYGKQIKLKLGNTVSS